jgi:hypothetical protein
VASQGRALSVNSFMTDCVDRLRKVPFSNISSWPEYPAMPPMPLNVPKELSSYTFNLMEDTLPTGEVRVAIQRYRSRLLGITAEVPANGFAVAPNGITRPLSGARDLGSSLVCEMTQPLLVIEIVLVSGREHGRAMPEHRVGLRRDRLPSHGFLQIERQVSTTLLGHSRVPETGGLHGQSGIGGVGYIGALYSATARGLAGTNGDRFK